MAGWLMAAGQGRRGRTGADRIAANGDVANKIGTYALACSRSAHGDARSTWPRPPRRSICSSTAGADIPIEHRAAERGARARRPRRGTPVYNPAFDVTPARNISAIVTEHGVHRPPYRFG